MALGEVKQKLLYPLINYLLEHKSTLATLIFFNRLSPTMLGVEIFVFCDQEMTEKELSAIAINDYLIKIVTAEVPVIYSTMW
jgi:hypothetical protein